MRAGDRKQGINKAWPEIYIYFWLNPRSGAYTTYLLLHIVIGAHTSSYMMLISNFITLGL